MVCIILFDEVFYKIVPWEDWSSALFLILHSTATCSLLANGTPAVCGLD
jgi:hypothetical protein